jgi:hypothetical protein
MLDVKKHEGLQVETVEERIILINGEIVNQSRVTPGSNHRKVKECDIGVHAENDMTIHTNNKV